MKKYNVFITANIALVLIAIVLTVTFFEIKIPSSGQAIKQGDAFCAIEWKSYNVIDDIDLCCYEAKKELSCVNQVKLFNEGKADWLCKTGEGDVIKYWLDNNAVQYCRQIGVWR